MADPTLLKQYEHYHHNMRAVAAMLMIGFVWHVSAALIQRGGLPMHLDMVYWVSLAFSTLWMIGGAGLWTWRPWARMVSAIGIGMTMAINLFGYDLDAMQGQHNASHLVVVVLGLYALYLLFHPVCRRLLMSQGNLERALLHVAA